MNAFGDALEERRVLVALGPLLVERFPLLEILEVSPDLDGKLWNGTLYCCHSKMRSLYA